MGTLSLNIFGSPNIIIGINRHEELGDQNKRCVNENELEKSSGIEKERKFWRCVFMSKKMEEKVTK